MSDILIPSFGESITAATVAAWHKGAGDAVARGHAGNGQSLHGSGSG